MPRVACSASYQVATTATTFGGLTVVRGPTVVCPTCGSTVQLVRYGDQWLFKAHSRPTQKATTP